MRSLPQGAISPGGARTLCCLRQESVAKRDLELAVDGGEQRGDGRAHFLVADVHYYRDR
jgi:hypothetical protein